MAIVFKTYNNRHQLHIYGENWKLKESSQLKELLAILGNRNAAKVSASTMMDGIEINLNEIIIDCPNTDQLKSYFSKLVDFKDTFQITKPEEAQKSNPRESGRAAGRAAEKQGKRQR